MKILIVAGLPDFIPNELPPTSNILNKFVSSVVMSCLSPISVSISVVLYKFDAATFPVKYPVEEHTNGLFIDI